jgi:hypothetical protein
VGAQKMQQAVQVQAVVRDVILGLVVIFVVSSDYFVRRRSRRRAAADLPDDTQAPPISPDSVKEAPA